MHFHIILLTLTAGFVLAALVAPLSAQNAGAGGYPRQGQSPVAQASPGSQTPAQLPTANESRQAAEARAVMAKPPLESISGTVTDTEGDVKPGASVVLEGATAADRRTATADDGGAFEFEDLKPGVPYHVTVSAKGFSSWSSPLIVLAPGQYQFLSEIRLRIEAGQTSVTVSASSADEIATKQVKIEEQQQVLGFIPNYYVVYGPDAAPLTKKLKFELAFKVSVNPVNFLGVAIMAGINQAGDTPDDALGARGYGERVGTAYADGLTDIMFGGAILPSLLHQDPRYFYQGTGTVKSRLFHALASPFVCKGDNGRWQPNYSSMGGDVISSAISNAYYPPPNRGVEPMFGSIEVNTAERIFSGVMQEFVLRGLTPRAKRRD